MQSMKEESKEIEVLKAVKSGKCLCRDIADSLGMDRDEAYRYLRRLVDAGTVRAQRGNGWTKYYFIGKNSAVLLDRYWKPPIFFER
jgi:DNA-binding IclR family transcriptional regulator